MCWSAFDNDDSPDIVEKAMKNPTKLADLDLDQFAISVQNILEHDYWSLFYFVYSELENPQKDIRGNYSDWAKVKL